MPTPAPAPAVIPVVSAECSVFEPEHPLHYALGAGDGARERKRLQVVLGVAVGLGAEAGLELGQGDGGARLAHVVPAAARLARVLDGVTVQQVVGAGRS